MSRLRQLHLPHGISVSPKVATLADRSDLPGGLPPHRLCRDLGAVAQTELGVDVREVDLHGAAGDEHALTDLGLRRRETLPAPERPLARSASATHVRDRLVERERFALAGSVRHGVVAERV